MTLTDLLPLVHDLPAEDKIKLIRILAEQLDQDQSILALEPNKTYLLATPYSAFGAGEALMEVMEHRPDRD